MGDPQLRVDDAADPGVVALLSDHLAWMHRHSPPESVFALDLDGLRQPSVTFWTVWIDDDVVGCGALKELDPTAGEVKSMRTVAAHVAQGIGALVLDHVIATARERGYRALSLETGATAPFEPAHRLYRRAGFVECGPFADYTDTTFSRYFTLAL